MRGKLLSMLWLAAVVSGCGRKAGSTAGGSDTTLAPASDTTAIAPATGKPQILAVTVRVRGPDGKVGDLEVNLDQREGSDALFFSLDAVQNFVVPFYAHRKGEGPDSSAAILTAAQDQLKKTGIIVILHKLKCKVLIPVDLWRGEFPRRL